MSAFRSRAPARLALGLLSGKCGDVCLHELHPHHHVLPTPTPTSTGLLVSDQRSLADDEGDHLDPDREHLVDPVSLNLSLGTGHSDCPTFDDDDASTDIIEILRPLLPSNCPH
ncbi:hypothetical protein PLICRDRAFT_173688 [Plicaturopsis crispa FD-325 SS-3]|nr:hypothetical protein PLICRDRAFT_173688 [Plicaturopsis crispa FD-325 SS-3]